jgi:DNA-binding transcriptional MerR regulator
MLQAWTAEEVETLIGVPQRTVRRWLAQGLVCLRLHRTLHPRERLRFVQDDIENLWVIACLRHQGVSMQRLRRILVRLAGMRLADFKAVLVDGDDVIGVRHEQGDVPPVWERLTDGQVVVRLTTIRERLTVSPGERLGEAWELLLRVEEVTDGDAR